MVVVNKVHKQGLQHHAPSHINMHPHTSSCSRSPQFRLAATMYLCVGMHGYVGHGTATLFVCHPYIGTHSCWYHCRLTQNRIVQLYSIMMDITCTCVSTHRHNDTMYMHMYVYVYMYHSQHTTHHSYVYTFGGQLNGKKTWAMLGVHTGGDMCMHNNTG